MEKFICGNDAVAEGVRLARPHVISAYPITPQTIAVERLSDMCESGELKADYMHVESEHSALAAAMGVSSVGARSFTATSSQGLLYMAECLPYASGARLPIVMMNANRAIATPWNIYGDQMDSMFLLNSGWLQVYVEDAQEALDMMIQAYRIAEDKAVMAPVMVNLDGFVLTHTYELVDIPSQASVDAFLPAIDLKDQVMTLDAPKSLCISAGNDFNFEFKIKQEQDLTNSKTVIETVDQEFYKAFGRKYHGLLETYKMDDAEAVLITTGSITGTTRIVVDQMRQAGQKVGLLKLRYLRPFPKEALTKALEGIKIVGVLDKNISFGYEGTIYTNVNSTLTHMATPPESINFIGGLGGRDITKENIQEAYEMMLKGDIKEKVQYLNVRCDQS